MESPHFDVVGSEALPTLVLLHGFMSCNLQWSLNREPLARHLRLVEVELWGHGKSPAPTDPDRYRVERYVEALERIRGALGLDRWLVCGQSFGAGIAIRYALAHPGATRGLVFTNSRSALNDLGSRPSPARGLEAWEALDRRSVPFHPCHARRFPAGLQRRMMAAADAIPAYALWQATSTTARDTSCRDVAARLAVPTLLVNGRYEKVFQPDRDFAERTIPGVEIVDLEAGHSVNIEAAAAFDAALLDFAQRNP